MSQVSASDLGAWEDRPRRNLDVDVTQTDLESKDAFVLTRVDGQASIAEICSVTGMGERVTLTSLVRLLQFGLITVEASSGERRLIRMTPDRRKAPAKTTRKVERTMPPFFGVDTDDAAWLQQFGVSGYVPGRPVRRGAAGKYGDHSFDQERLKVVESLTVDHKKEIIFLSENIGKLDHYEFLGLQPTDDRKVIRNAYFEFSKRFHPDTVFRREVGEFRELIEKVYKYGTEVYEALNSSSDLRDVYLRSVQARDRAWRGELDKEKLQRDQKVRDDFKRKAEGRKEALRSRLKRNTDSRRNEGQTKAVGGRIDKAQQFYNEGITHFENESYLSATNALRLAVNYDPNNEEYVEALQNAEHKVRQVKAEQQWKRGYIQESVGRIPEALAAYEAACEAWPRHEYCAHIAQLFLKYDDDLRKAADLASKAVEGDPSNVDYLLLLGRIYRKAKLNAKAVGVYERAVALDPKNVKAKKALKALK